MRYPVPNLRRDLAVRIALLIMAFVAVVPAVLAGAIAIAGIAGLIILRLALFLPGKRHPATA